MSPPKRTPAKPPRTKPAPRRGAVPATARIAPILARLKAAYPDAHCALDHADPYQLLVATILSAQCTDARVNLVTPALFARYPSPAHLARARQADVEALVQSTGFFRNKAKNLIAMAQAVMAEHGGEIPRTMAALHALPGVGRKTANVVLGNAFGLNEGVTVDTHVTRLAGLLQLTRHTDPVKIEQDLMQLVPREDWTLVSHLLILHGRAVCIARRPQCDGCVLLELCPGATR
ncbi:MAG: endonuclease III [Gemmatimonadales bacterium]|nr:endonuclease III [Gemmatimonadales bacterium]MBP9199485.1 endonuclease III [Gemmatimonadales bacterium]